MSRTPSPEDMIAAAKCLRRSKGHAAVAAWLSDKARHNDRTSAARRKWTLDENSFRRVTRESAYWLGFLMADGSVSRNRIVINLAAKDIGHLDKFLKFVKCENRGIYKNKKNCVGICVSSRQMTWDLAKHGIVERKTYRNIPASKSVCRFASFWLGLMDGDGCISWHSSKSGKPKTPRVSFYGSKPLMKQAAAMMLRFGLGRHSIHPQGSIWNVRITGEKAQDLLKIMYSRSPVWLDRKKKKSEDAMKWRPQPLGAPKLFSVSRMDFDGIWKTPLNSSGIKRRKPEVVKSFKSLEDAISLAQSIGKDSLDRVNVYRGSKIVWSNNSPRYLDDEFRRIVSLGGYQDLKIGEKE